MKLSRFTRLMLIGVIAFCWCLRATTCHLDGSGYVQAAEPDEDHRLFIADDSFDLKRFTLQSEKPVVVDFYASHCGPCRFWQPTMKEFARDNAGKVVVLRIDVDQCITLVETFNVDHIPVTLVFNKATLTDRLEGIQSRSKLEKSVAKAAIDR